MLISALIAIGLLLTAWLGVGRAGDPVSEAASIDQDSLFAAIAWRYGVDADLLKAIAAVESGGQTRAVSRAGAVGLMQLMPDTARRFQVSDPFDPVDNALGAARFLAYLQRRQPSVNGDPNLVQMLAAYNAGEGAVRRYQGVPPYPETQSYVRRVLWAYLLADQGASVIGPRGTAEAGARHQAALSQAPDPSINGKSSVRGQDAALLGQLVELRRERAQASNTELQAERALESAGR